MGVVIVPIAGSGINSSSYSKISPINESLSNGEDSFSPIPPSSPLSLPPSPLPSPLPHLTSFLNTGGCSCDPAIYTSNCDQTPCTPFMGTFLFFQVVLLFCYFFTIIHVEVTSRKKSLLWRIILPSAGISCLCMYIILYCTYFWFFYICFAMIS
jgi:hypothetical protein